MKAFPGGHKTIFLQLPTQELQGLDKKIDTPYSNAFHSTGIGTDALTGRKERGVRKDRQSNAVYAPCCFLHTSLHGSFHSELKMTVTHTHIKK